MKRFLEILKDERFRFWGLRLLCVLLGATAVTAGCIWYYKAGIWASVAIFAGASILITVVWVGNALATNIMEGGGPFGLRD